MDAVDIETDHRPGLIEVHVEAGDVARVCVSGAGAFPHFGQAAHEPIGGAILFNTESTEGSEDTERLRGRSG